MLNLSEIANNLTEKEQGVWFSGNTATCSYPEDSSNRYFSIENDSFWFRHRNDAIISVVKMFSPGGFILDVGGANGYVTFRLKNSGFEAILLEPNIKGLQNAKKRGLSPVICSTATDAGFKDQVIPAIGLFDVLEHIEDDRGFLKELKRILSPNGRLYLTVPAYQTLWSSEDEYTGQAYGFYFGYKLVDKKRVFINVQTHGNFFAKEFNIETSSSTLRRKLVCSRGIDFQPGYNITGSLFFYVNFSVERGRFQFSKEGTSTEYDVDIPVMGYGFGMGVGYHILPCLTVRLKYQFNQYGMTEISSTVGDLGKKIDVVELLPRFDNIMLSIQYNFGKKQ